MSKFIYNPDPVYTLLFKGGSLEIKPKKSVEVTDFDYESKIFEADEKSGKVGVYATLDEVPQDLSPEVKLDIVTKAPVAQGLTESELKAELERKAAEQKPAAVTSTIGVPEVKEPVEAELTAPNFLEEGVKEVTEPVEPTEPVKAKPGRKAKAAE